MGLQVKGLVDKPWRAFLSFTPGQKAVTLVAVIGLLVGGFFMFSWSSAPAMTPLFDALSAKDSAAIVAKLDADGVAYTFADGGATIMVPKDKVYALRVEMAGAGLPASTSQSGLSTISSSPLTASKLQQDMAAQDALQNELSTTIEAIDGIDSAMVTLALPKDDAFSDSSSKPTSAVLVKTQQGVTLSSDNVRAIQHLVASSIPGMQPSDVTVTDGTTGNLLSSTADNGGISSDDRTSQTNSYDDQMSQQLQTMLDKVVGPGHSVVRVNADLNFDNIKSTTRSYALASPSGVPLWSTTDSEKYSGTNGSVIGGVLGPDNIAVPTTGASGSASPQGYEHVKGSQENTWDTTVTDTVKAPGDVRKLSIAVILDTATAGNVNPAEITQLVSNASGVNAARGDQVQVSRLAFDTTGAAAQAKQLAAAQAAKSRSAMMGYAKTGALVLVVLLTLLLTWLKSRKTRKVPVETADLERIAELERINAELEAARDARALEGGARGVLALPAAPEHDPDGEEYQRLRNEVGELVDRQPEEVAMLLRGWLADRRS